MIFAPTGILGIKAIIGKFNKDILPCIYEGDYKSSVNPFKLWLGMDKSIDWDRSLFYNILQRLRLALLNLIFKDMTGNNLKLHISEIKFQGIDFDVYQTTDRNFRKIDLL